jgi:hypothetical protein
VQIAAILTVTDEASLQQGLALSARDEESAHSYATIDILGASLVQRTVDKLSGLSAIAPTVLTGRNVSDQVLPPRSARSCSFIDAWEKALADDISQGAELLLLTRVSTYSDLDYADVLEFHTGSRSPLTQVYGADGSLDVAVVDATLLRNTGDLMRRALSNLIPQQRRFHYSGYINRLRTPRDLHRLMQDGLNSRCNLRPIGKEVRPSVWCGEEADIDSTVRITAPVFVGAASQVASGCTLTGTTSIESDCHIDCGTLVDDALVLAGTYIGPALDVKRAVVGDEKIFSLDRDVEVNVSDARLIGNNVKQAGFFAGLTSLLRSEATN